MIPATRELDTTGALAPSRRFHPLTRVVRAKIGPSSKLARLHVQPGDTVPLSSPLSRGAPEWTIAIGLLQSDYCNRTIAIVTTRRGARPVSFCGKIGGSDTEHPNDFGSWHVEADR